MAVYAWRVYSGSNEVGGAELTTNPYYGNVSAEHANFSMSPGNYTADVWTLGTESRTNLSYSWYVNGKSSYIKRFYTVGANRDQGVTLNPAIELATSDYFNSNNPTERSRTFTLAAGPYNTYYGATLKDTAEYTIYTYVVTLNAPPTFDSTNVSFDTNYVYAGLTTASVSISDLSAKYGGNISSAVLKIGNQTSVSRTTDGSLSIALDSAGIFTPQVVVTDSRGQTSTMNLDPITVLAYAPPTVNFTVERTTSAGESDDEGKAAVVTATFNYTSAVTHLSAPTVVAKDPTDQTLSASVTWYTNRSLTTTVSNWANIASGTTLYAKIDNSSHNLFNTQYSYQISITPIDTESSGTTVTRTLGSAFYTIDFLAGGHGITFGKPAINEGFECDMEATFNDAVLFEDDIQVDGAATFSDTVLFEEDIEADKDIHLGLPDYQTADTTDKALYDAIIALGWNDCLEN